MRREAAAKEVLERGAQGNAEVNMKARGNTPVGLMKQAKTPTGKGLGKAGAKRLGRLLKRAMKVQEEPAGKGRASLPKTPVRLFKHQIQTEADSAPKANTEQTKPASHHVSQLILGVVSQCKHRGGISMAELKQTLAAGGYKVAKNNRRVNLVTRRLVHNETLVRTTRRSTFRLNSKADTTYVRTSTVKPPKPKGDLKQRKTVRNSSKGAEKSQRRAIETPKPRSKSYKPKGKMNRRTAKSRKPRRNVRKPARGTLKLTGKTHKPAGRSHKSRRRSPKTKRKAAKPAGKKRRSSTNQATRVGKAPRKTQRSRKRQPKRNQHPYKSSPKRQPPRWRLPKTRSTLRTRRRQIARRRAYCY